MTRWSATRRRRGSAMLDTPRNFPLTIGSTKGGWARNRNYCDWPERRPAGSGTILLRQDAVGKQIFAASGRKGESRAGESN
jgi:hypothetical protein